MMSDSLFATLVPNEYALVTQLTQLTQLNQLNQLNHRSP